VKQAAGSKTKSQVWVVEKGVARSRLDHLATEEPLEIRLVDPAMTLAVTMRTPGADFELAAGFLFSEGVIHHRQDLAHLSYCLDSQQGEQRYNIVNVALRPGLSPNFQSLERHFYISSACGVCGKTSLEALRIRGCAPLPLGVCVEPSVIYALPSTLQAHQGIFRATGGLHAAALFDLKGNLIAVQEDVGRHNALDKLIGSSLLNGQLDWQHSILMVSGRSSYEILQKALVAKVPIICSVSAPSSLAVSLAQEFNITLIGFLRGEQFNLYSGRDRISIP
jgi:FdhD protein